MKALIEAASELISNPLVVALGGMTFVEVVPIKIRPWTALFKWIGKIILGDLPQEVSQLKKDFESKNADDMRWEILSFANGCRHKRRHTKEEWNHVIAQIRKYEKYVDDKGIVNGVIEEDSKYLRELYHDISINDDFLQ